MTAIGTAMSATTDGSGAFEIPVPPGTYSLIITAPNLQPATTGSLVVSAGWSTNAGTIALGAAQTFAFGIKPAIASGNGTATATINLNTAAASTTVFTLTSDSANLSPPASVTIATGKRALSFPVTYAPVSSPTWVTVSATSGSVTNQARVMLTPTLAVASMSLSASSVHLPTAFSGVVQLTAPAPAGGVTVGLRSSVTTAATVPASIFIPEGAYRGLFYGQTLAVAANATTQITASLPSGSVTQPVFVSTAPALTAVSAPAYARYTASPPKTVSIAVYLNDRAPAGGAVVSLTSSNPTAIPVPASVTVSSCCSSVVTAPVLGATTSSPVVITANYAGISRTTSVTVTAPITAQKMFLGAPLGVSTYVYLEVSEPLPSGGTATFQNSNPSVFSLPTSSPIASGDNEAYPTGTYLPTTYGTQVVLTGSYGSRDQQITVDVPSATSPSGVSVGTSVQGGFSGTGSVALTYPAPAGGVLVALASDQPSVLSMPPSVTVDAGSSSATFTFSASVVPVSTSARVFATSGGDTQVSSVTVLPPRVASVSVAPTSTPGGNTVAGTLTLTGPAPPEGYVVNISSNSGLALPPPTVTVPGGATAMTFPIPTAGATASTTSATLTASDGFSTQTTSLQITKTSLLSVTFSPSTVQGGSPSTGTVVLNGLAPAGGAVVSLSSNQGSAVVPASVTITAGNASGTFTVTTSAVASNTTAVITATYQGFTQPGSLVVTQLPSTLSSIYVPPAVSGGLNATGTVYLSTAAPVGGLPVALTSALPAVAAVSTSVTVPAGALSANFTITTTGVAVSTPVVISATYAGVTQNGTITVNPASLSSVSLVPFALTAGSSSTGTLSLVGKAPPAGLVISLASSNPGVATVQSTVTVPSGASTVTFPVTTNGSISSGTSTITANGGYQGLTVSALLTVTPSPIALSQLTLSAPTAVSGQVVTATVLLNQAAPVGGVVVLLASSDTTVATVPSGVVVSAGATSATASVTTKGVGASSPVTISATFNGATLPAALTVTPAVLSQVTVTPAAVAGGASASGVVNLSGPAPPAGAVVALSSSDATTASVPASVTVASGAWGAAFTVTTTTVSVSKPITITAVYSGVTLTAPLSVDPFGVASITAPANMKAGDFGVSGTVTLNSPAPPGGSIVSLTAIGAVRYFVSTQTGYLASANTTVTVPAGQTSEYFNVIAPWTSSAGSGTLTATLNSVSKSTSVTVTAGTATFSIAPSTLSRGGSTLGSILFDGYPPITNSIPVTLSSSNSGVVLAATSVQACPVLPCGAIGSIQAGYPWYMPIGVTAGSSTGATTVTATFSGLSQTAALAVNPSVLTSLTARPTAFPGGASVPITANLDSPAPPEGALISLTSSSLSLFPVPATLSIAPGQQTASLNAIPQSVGATTPITLSGTYGPDKRNVSLKILADGAAHVFGTVVDARVYDHDQPLPGVSLAFSTDAANATTTDAFGAFSLFTDPGATALTLSSPGFATTTLPNFTAALNGAIDEGVIRLKYVLGGSTLVSGRVVNAGGSPVAGATGSLEGYQGSFTTDGSGYFSFNGPNLGRYRLTFSAPATPTRTDDTFVFVSTATTSGLYDFVLDSTSRPVLSAVSVSPNPVVGGGANTTLNLTLSAPAPSSPAPGGATVSLVMSDPNATPPYTSADISAGSATGGFVLQVNTVTVPTPTVITAFYGGVQLSTTLTVIPATGVLSSFTVNPSSVVGGSTSVGTVTLNGPAPAGGVTVGLSSDDGAAIVPSGVFVPAGATTAAFTMATSLVGLTRTANLTATYGYTRTATLTITPPAQASLIGVAPGWTLPGDMTPVLYGSSIQPGSTVTFTGPVYALAAPTTPLCTLGSNCPSAALAATVDVGGAYAAFAIPPGAAPGFYHLKTRSPVGVDSTNNEWIAVDSAQQTRGVVAPGQHTFAQRIYPGQTVTGTLTGDNPQGSVSDYNYYYFVATAGSQISASMNRVDTSMTWENPASLDPQIQIIAPDGFIYSNLQAFDNQPGVDLNASLSHAVLPQTGVYFIVAETTRGSGQYQLSFNVDSMAPAPAGNRAIPVTGNHNTLPLNTNAGAQAMMLDSRGWPVAGAQYSFSGQNGTGDTGTATFQSGASGSTSLNGTADATVRMTTQGKARFKAALSSPQLSQLVYLPSGEAAAAMGGVFDEASGDLKIPVYQATGFSSARLLSLSDKGAQLSAGGIQSLPQEQLRGRVESLSVKGARVAQGAASANEHSPGVPLRSATTPLAYVRTPLVITACSGELEVFTQSGVTPATLNAPFSVVLTDVTVGEAQGVVDTAAGIHGHKIEKADGTSKVMRFHLDVKDSTGNAPTHPVLVNLAVGGAKHGTLILDPTGAKIECAQASFIWHEQDAQGTIIAPNEEFEYRLGTLSIYAGAVPDPAHSGQVLPVWGVAENLTVTISTVDGTGNATPLTTYDASFPVHPEPGRPKSFVSPFELVGGPPDAAWQYWADYLTTTVAGVKQSPRYSIPNSFYLVDRWNNVTFGYPVDPAHTTVFGQQNLSVTFKDQLAGVNQPGYDITFPGYEVDLSWSNAGGSMPTGADLSFGLHYSGDPTYGTGDIAPPRSVRLNFISGTQHALTSQQDYELRFGVDDTGWPVTVPPGATGSALPTTQDTRNTDPTLSTVPKRLTFQIVTGTNVPWAGEIYETPHNAYDALGNFAQVQYPDPHLETSEPGRMKLSVIESTGAAVTDVAFKVHNCPRYDHEGSPRQPTDMTNVRACSDTPVQSTGGAIASYSVNPAGSSRGYMGVELLQAPTNPGNYYIKIESIDSIYRIKQLPGLTVDATPAGQFKGAFPFVRVNSLELLDASFMRLRAMDPAIYVNASVPLYLSYVAPSSTAAALQGTIDIERLDLTGGGPQAITLTKAGASNRYVAGFTLSRPQAQVRGPAPQAGFASLSVAYPKALFVGAITGGPNVSHLVRTVSVSVASVGFMNDFKLYNYPVDTPIDPLDTDPLWQAGTSCGAYCGSLDGAKGAAYLANTSPAIFASFNLVPPVAPTEGCYARIRVTDLRPPTSSDPTPAAVVASGDLFLLNDVAQIRDLRFSAPWSYNKVITTSTFRWEVDYWGNGVWEAAGESGGHKFYWLPGAPVNTPFKNAPDHVYEAALQIALDNHGYNDLPDRSDMALRVNNLVHRQIQFNPQLPMPDGNPLRVWLSAVATQYPAEAEAELLRGLLRSIGIQAETKFVWMGTPATAWVYEFDDTQRGAIDASFQCDLPSMGESRAQPHYIYHVLVEAGQQYDPTYDMHGRLFDDLAILEWWDVLIPGLSSDGSKAVKSIDTVKPTPHILKDANDKRIVCPHH